MTNIIDISNLKLNAKNIPESLPSSLLTEEERESLRKNILMQSPKKRKDFVKSVITIPTPQFTAGIDLIRSYYDMSGQPDCGGVRVYGESGSGKSYLATYFLGLHPQISNEFEVTLPILYIKLSDSMAIRPFLRRILAELGYRFSVTSDVEELTNIVISALLTLSVKLIIFDEAQEFGEGRGDARPSRIGNKLKIIHDATNIPQIYFGVQPKLERFFNLAEQLGERITAIHNLRPMNNDADFLGLLKAYDKSLPMEEPAYLAERFGNQIYVATNGNFRRVRRLLAHAVLLASMNSDKSINQKHLFDSCEYNFGKENNPFK